MDVGTRLRNLGLGQYESSFKENEIDCEVLPNLTSEDLGPRRFLYWAPSQDFVSNS